MGVKGKSAVVYVSARVAPATPRRDALSPRCAHPRLFLSHVPDAPTTAHRRVRRPPHSPQQQPSRRQQLQRSWRRALPPWLPPRPRRRLPPPGLGISSPQGARRPPQSRPIASPATTAKTGTGWPRRSQPVLISGRYVQARFLVVPALSYEVPIPRSSIPGVLLQRYASTHFIRIFSRKIRVQRRGLVGLMFRCSSLNAR